MPDVSPSVTSQEMLCVDTAAPPAALIVFGASGDLTRRKLIASMFQLYRIGLLTDDFYLVGCGRTQYTDDAFRELAVRTLNDSSAPGERDAISSFVKKCYYLSGSYQDPGFYAQLKDRLAELDSRHSVHCCHVFYLATPPHVYHTVAENLGNAGLSKGNAPGCKRPPRLVVEKPFGRDLGSARQLNRQLLTYFDESQIYRIDHYLGKETVQNILMFRFANTIFEPLWNRNYIDHIQITIAESMGIEHRAGYYDTAGALRDMFQNHMLGMLSLVAMEPPTSFEADRVRDEKVKLLRAIHPLDSQRWSDSFVRGQYTSGTIDGSTVPAYREEPGVAADSNTETFVAAKLFVDNWRWRNVPFFLRTGKRLAKKVTDVAITFRQVPHSMFESAGIQTLPPNMLVLQIQPEEGIRLSFQAKRPGSKICMSTLNMSFNYSEVFGQTPPEAYQRLLLDCMVGDQTLFTRRDDVELSWNLMMPILDAWSSEKQPPYLYPAGADSFDAADKLILAEGRKWRKLNDT